MPDSRMDFGLNVLSQGRLKWRGQWSSIATYAINDAVSFSGSSFIAIAGSVNIATSNTLFWDTMCSAGGVSTVAGRSGNVVLVGSDVSDHDLALGVPLLDASAFLKAAQQNTTANTQVGTTYTIVAADRGKLLTLNNGSAIAVTVPAASGSFAAGWFCEVTNLGAGLVTLTPTGTIDGAASLTVKQFQSITLTSVGGNWVCLRTKPLISAADLPNPTASALGGVESIAAVSHQFLTSISTSGVPALAQPVIVDLAVGTSANLAAIISDETGSGALVFANTPTLVTPVLGVATATSVNGVTIPSAADTAALLVATQTLKNKTLTGATSGNNVTLVNQQGPLAAVVGTAGDANVFTFTIPANTVGAGKGLRIKVVYLHSTGTVSTSFKVKLGATTIVTNTYAPATTSAIERQTIEIFNNAGVTNAQNWTEEHLLNIVANTNLVAGINAGTSAIDFTSSQVFAFTFNVAASDQVTPKALLIELIQ